MSCVAVAPANWTSTQIATSFSEASRLPVRGSKPSTTRPRPRLSAFCQRMQTGQRVGKPQQPHCASEKEKGACADHDDAENVENDTHPRSARWGSSASGGAAPFTKSTEAKAARSASPSATSSTPRTPVAEATQERGDSAGAKELRRHHAIGVRRSSEDADETNRHREQNEARGCKQKVSHGRAPG
jgi:hypothetical protein